MSQESQSFVFLTQTGEVAIVFTPKASEWILATLSLETAGPVVAGFNNSILPVGSGKARQLVPGQEVRMVISPGQTLYMAANSVERVNVQIEALPWLEELLAAEVAVAKGAGEIPPTPQNAPVNIGRYGFKMPGGPKPPR